MSDRPAHDTRRLFLQPAPGYWATKRILCRLKRLQDLIRHRERWSGQFDLAQPIEALMPNVPEQQRRLHLDSEIMKLLRLAHWYLQDAAVETHFLLGDGRHRRSPAENYPDYDIPLDYFRLPRDPGTEHLAFNVTMQVLTDGIGVYEVRLAQAKRDLYNPIAWLSHIIRLPISVMERAGFLGNEKTESFVLAGYTRFVQIVTALILVLMAVLLGIKIPWNEIIASVLKWAFGAA